MGDGLPDGRAAENVLFGEINIVSADSLVREGSKEGVQALYETDTRCGRNDMNHV